MICANNQSCLFSNGAEVFVLISRENDIKVLSFYSETCWEEAMAFVKGIEEMSNADNWASTLILDKEQFFTLANKVNEIIKTDYALNTTNSYKGEKHD